MNGYPRVDICSLGLPDSYVPRQYSEIWKIPAPNWRDRLNRALDGCASAAFPPVFFRADDIGAGGRAFEAMCKLFRHHAIPLAMAVVPAWLSSARQDQLFRAAPMDEPIWGWHQHGWRHVNWQKTGKKSEFGDNRPFEKQSRDIQQGRLKMELLFGDYFIPVFTPPWNRLCASTLKILQTLRFEAVSLSGPIPRGIKSSAALSNLKVQLDLHTRKSADPNSDFSAEVARSCKSHQGSALLHEISTAPARKENIGFMIHHHRMTLFAFEFLDALLYNLKNRVQARFLTFGEIVYNRNEDKTGSSLC